MKKAILVVSFGTSYNETRKKTIDCIEQKIAEQYPDFAQYRAWSSKKIRMKLEKRDGIVIPDVKDALKQMKADGMEYIVVQPTYVISGIENDQMTDVVKSYADQFKQAVIGTPLLTTYEDREMTAKAIIDEFKPEPDKALVLMGHGSEHHANSVYTAMDSVFSDLGYPNILMGTVEGYPTLESVIKRTEKVQAKQVILTPFMIVAGDHANNDLAGDKEDSWKSRFEAQGYEVRCVLKGLGEYEQIQEIFLKHVQEAVDRITDQYKKQ